MTLVSLSKIKGVFSGKKSEVEKMSSFSQAGNTLKFWEDRQKKRLHSSSHCQLIINGDIFERERLGDDFVFPG